MGRDNEGQRLNQVGRDSAEYPALPDELAHVAEGGPLERPQAAVDRLKGVRRRCPADIASIDNRDRQSPARGVPCNRSPVDAGADDEDVKGSVFESREASSMSRILPQCPAVPAPGRPARNTWSYSGIGALLR